MPENGKKTPKLSTLSKVFYSTSLTGDRTQLCYVQEIPKFLTAKESITYSALDMEDERLAKGKRKAEALEIPFLFTEEQWDEVDAIADSNDSYYIFIQLPESTAKEAGKPLTFYFTASLDISMDTIAIDEMLKSICTVYRDSAVKHSKGFPTAQ